MNVIVILYFGILDVIRVEFAYVRLRQLFPSVSINPQASPITAALRWSKFID